MILGRDKSAERRPRRVWLRHVAAGAVAAWPRSAGRGGVRGCSALVPRVGDRRWLRPTALLRPPAARASHRPTLRRDELENDSAASSRRVGDTMGRVIDWSNLVAVRGDRSRATAPLAGAPWHSPLPASVKD